MKKLIKAFLFKFVTIKEAFSGCNHPKPPSCDAIRNQKKSSSKETISHNQTIFVKFQGASKCYSFFSPPSIAYRSSSHITLSFKTLSHEQHYARFKSERRRIFLAPLHAIENVFVRIDGVVYFLCSRMLFGSFFASCFNPRTQMCVHVKPSTKAKRQRRKKKSSIDKKLTCFYIIIM